MTVELWRFPVSHYCDKVEFALRVKGLPYRVVTRAMQSYSTAAAVSGQDEWPFLVTEEGPVTWDRAFAWAEKARPSPPLWPSDPARADRARRLVHYFDRVVGHTVRRVLFSRIVRDPDVARSRHPNSLKKRLLLRGVLGPVVRRRYGATDWTVAQDLVHLDALFAGEGLVPPPARGRPLLAPGDDAPGAWPAHGGPDVTAATLLGPILRVPVFRERWGRSALSEWADHELAALRALPVPPLPRGEAL